jgi:hypothetical protein
VTAFELLVQQTESTWSLLFALVLRAGEIHGEQLCRASGKGSNKDPLIEMRVRALSIGGYTERGDLD